MVWTALSILIVAFSAVGWNAEGTAPAQQREDPIKGVVWQPPADADRAAADLRQMAAMGVEAVRVPAPAVDEMLHLPLADTLGLQLFVDLPFSDLHARALSDSLTTDSSWFTELARWIDRHPSVRHVGLAQRSDTGAARSCRALSEFASALRARSAVDVHVYYTTVLARTDRCASAVDFVLLDSRDADPAVRLARWRKHQGSTPVGLANVGKRLVEVTTDGLRNPFSTAAQARYLERQLGGLLGTRDPAMRAFFVYSWRDTANPARTGSPSFRAVRNACCYGLLTASDEARPALQVVEGFFVGTQTTFAFQAGVDPGEATPWVILAGWLTLALLGTVYATSILLQRLLPRYVLAPGFYRESVREGRELPGRATHVLTGITALAAGTTGAAILTALRDGPALTWLIARVPESAQVGVAGLMEEAWLLVLVLAALSLLSVLFSTAAYILLSARKRRLSPSQGLTLVLWPRWPIFLLMLGAMVVSTLTPEQARAGALVLAATWVLLVIVRTTRVVRDGDHVVTGATRGELLALSPLTPLVTFCLLVVLFRMSELMFVWRLLLEGW